MQDNSRLDIIAGNKKNFNQVQINFVKRTFVKWNDIQNDKIFIERLNQYLRDPKLLFATGIAKKRIIHSKDNKN